jgi:hypothetical protein
MSQPASCKQVVCCKFLESLKTNNQYQQDLRDRPPNLLMKGGSKSWLAYWYACQRFNQAYNTL